MGVPLRTRLNSRNGSGGKFQQPPAKTTRRPNIESEMDRKAPNLDSRIRGALLGLACGDALGAPAEFKSQAEVKRRFGTLCEMVGGGIWKPGEWTDDTGMALCVAGGILADASDPVPETGRLFLQWQKTAKDVGSTCSAALGAFKRGANTWPAAARSLPAVKVGRAAGNGSLMRTLPVALAYADRAEMLRQSARLSAMTHWDAQAEACCAIYNEWVARLLAGETRIDAWHSALWQVQREAATPVTSTREAPGMAALPTEFWPRLMRVEGLAYEDLQPSGYAGFVTECLEAAAWCVLHGESLEQTLVLAVNLAGEADTIAAVAGGAAGAYWGQNAIPPRWLEALHERERLQAAGDGLQAVREGKGDEPDEGPDPDGDDNPEGGPEGGPGGSPETGVPVTATAQQRHDHDRIYATPRLPAFNADWVARGVLAGRSRLAT